MEPAAADEGLPEWEPLTPELVEDEAIRGDFVMRWVVVGLALLLGVSQIAETRTLLHLKNGLYLAGHGFLPSAKDPFSYTASDRKWTNLAWVFDLAMAGVYSLGGGIGLSLIQGLLAALAFGLLAHTFRPQIRTWWGSICAGLALLVCYPQFTIQPELVTLLGISFVLWTLVRAEEPGQSRQLWRLVPLLWLWAQLDQRAWVGWFLLVLWTAGEKMSRDTAGDGEKSLLWKVTLASLGVMAIHPFLWESWLAPLRMYLTDYPAMRFAYPQPSVVDQGFYPLWHEFHWTTLNHRLIAALFLMVATVSTLFLNRSRIRWSHLSIVIGINALAVLATHELAVASLVNCVVCTLNAQTWYRERFGQIYSVDWRELLFSRGGRAVTVVSFFAMAWVILSGRLDGPNGKRTGVGFDVHLAGAMNDYQNLNAALYDDHPFNFSMRQGDLFVWGGQKSFIDSRAGLFYGNDDTNLLKVHNQVRRALRDRDDEKSDSSTWKAAFDKYQIHQACPRLNGPFPAPDYHTFASLMSSSDFELTSLNASTAVFVLTGSTEPAVTTFIREHARDPIQAAFRTKVEKTEDPIREFGKPATTYDNLFSLRRTHIPQGVQAAQHEYILATAIGSGSNSKRCAEALLAIRHANEGLRLDPNSPDGYRVLGMAYSFLSQIESNALNPGGQPIPIKLRYFQTVAALQQGLFLQPDDAGIIRQLLHQYEMMGRVELQFELIRRLSELPPGPGTSAESHEQELVRMKEAVVQLEEIVERIKTTINDQLNQGLDRLQVATAASRAGGLISAIKTLEDDAIYLAKNPLAKLALGGWMIEVGRVQDAADQLNTVASLAIESPFVAWRDMTAISALTTAEYTKAIVLWDEQIRTMTAEQTESTLQTLPFLTLNAQWLGADSYPTSTISKTAQMLQSVRIEGGLLRLQTAMAQMESGATEDATKTLKRIVAENPISPFRPLVRFYLDCLTGELIDLNIETPEAEEFSELAEAVK